jgi:hypothetical protein
MTATQVTAAVLVVHAYIVSLIVMKYMYACEQ